MYVLYPFVVLTFNSTGARNWHAASYQHATGMVKDQETGTQKGGRGALGHVFENYRINSREIILAADTIRSVLKKTLRTRRLNCVMVSKLVSGVMSSCVTRLPLVTDHHY